ncbi:MAG: redoxin domain-containing protein [Planctomycetota bacterium]|jgi:peroxiredoxin
MKKHLISIVVVLAVLMVAWTAFGQGERRTRQRQQSENMRQRFENMSEEEREKFRAEMRERRERYENMSEEEREKFRAEMRKRGGPMPRRLGREEQLKAIEIIQEQAAKLKAAIEATRGPEGRRRSQDLSEEERTKLREKFAEASKRRQNAIRAIEEQLAKLRGPMPPGAEPPGSIREMRAIRELALKENAEETAKRLEKLIAGYQRGPQRESGGRQRGPGREREPGQRPQGPDRPPRERPARPKRDVEGAAAAVSDKKAPALRLTSFCGKTVNLSDYRGKIVVLEWLNFECPFVMYHYKQPNTMVKLANKYKDDNVVWLAVNSTSHTTPEANNDFAEKHKLSYLILDDRSGKVGHTYGAKTTPHMYVINARGNIVYAGAIDNSPMGKKREGVINYVDKTLAELTDGKPVSTRNTKPYGCSVKYAR